MKALNFSKFNRTNYGVFCLFFLLYLLPVFSFSQFSIREIIERTDTIQNEKKKASSLLSVAEYYMQDKPDSAIIFADQALDLSLHLKDSTYIVDAYRCLSVAWAGKMECDLSESFFLKGLPFAVDAKDSVSLYADMGAIYTICGNLQKAQECHNIARKIYIDLSDKSNLARLITNEGLLHTKNAHYYQALECYFEAMDICEEMNDEETIAHIYQNMGKVMALQNQYDKAVGYYNTALYGFEKLESFSSMASIYLNLGQIFIEQEQWDVAKHYLNKSYVIDTTYKLKHFESEALKLLGVTYLRINKLESAEILIEEAVRIQKELGFNNLMAESITLLAEVYYEQGRNNEALLLLESAEKRAANNNDELLGNIKLLKALVFASLRQFESAYFALKHSKSIEDSIFNIEKSKSIMNLELAYQTEKKEKQIDELKYKGTLRNEQLEKKSVQVYLLIVSVALMFVILVFLIFYWFKRQQVERQKRERSFLQGRFEAEERAKDEIANELHDDIGGQLIGLILQAQSSSEKNTQELKQLQDVYRDVRRLSHSLDEPIFVDVTLQEKIRNYLSELKEIVNFKVQFIDDLSLNWKGIADHQEIQRNLYRIVQELLTNTIKYAQAKTVDLQLLNESDLIILIYEDDGVGMLPDKLEFNYSFNTIRKRVDMFGGHHEIISSPSKGIFVKVAIPFKSLK